MSNKFLKETLKRVKGIGSKVADLLLKKYEDLPSFLNASPQEIEDQLGNDLPDDAVIVEWQDRVKRDHRQASTDLAKIKALGPRAARVLADNGVTLAALAQATIKDQQEMERILATAKIAASDPDSSKWKAQAAAVGPVAPPPRTTAQTRILVRDMRERNEDAYARLQGRADQLARKRQDQDGQLEGDLETELQAAEAILAQKNEKIVIDPLFKEVQRYQASAKAGVPDHVNGILSVDKNASAEEAARTLIAMYGIMLRENTTDPHPGQIVPDALAIVCAIKSVEGGPEDTPAFQAIRAALDNEQFAWQDVCDKQRRRPPSQRFANTLALAQAEYKRSQDLFDAIFSRVSLPDSAAQADSLAAVDWAKVSATLVDENVGYNDPHLDLKIREALSGHVGGRGDGTFLAGFEINLPDLEEQTVLDILTDNLNGMQVVYFSAMLEEMKFFQVRDQVMHNFRMGLTPFGRGRAGGMIYKMLREAPNRLSEYDRQNLYARALGMPGGDAAGPVNRDFHTLWLRFISAVSSFARQLTVDYLLRSNIPVRIHQEAVRKAGRDLAANLSLFGYGITFFAATELQQETEDIIELLSDNEVMSAYGARDMWGVIDQVATLELGGARDTVRWRTMAAAGAIIIRWLAKKAAALAAPGGGDILDINEVYRPRLRPQGSKATNDPYDSDLVNACERWLAVTGTPEAQVETYSQPGESPVMTSQPIPIPAAARELLQSVGVNGNFVM